jgi:hypothetical protein
MGPIYTDSYLQQLGVQSQVKGTEMSTTKKADKPIDKPNYMNMTLVLLDSQIEKLATWAAPDAAEDRPAIEKVPGVIASLAQQAAGGGLMITPEEMQRINDATGLDPSCGEDLIPLLSAGAGMEEGHHVVKAKVDPYYWQRLEDRAAMRETAVETVIQEMFDHCLEENWYEVDITQPRQKWQYLTMFGTPYLRQ